jgi:sugar phosphate isomerase/epimerase
VEARPGTWRAATSVAVGEVFYGHGRMGLGFSTLNHSSMFGVGPALAEQVWAAADAGFDLVALDIFSLRATIAAGDLAELAAVIADCEVEVLDICALGLGSNASTWDRERTELVAAAQVLRPRHVMVRFDGAVDAVAIERVRRVAAELAPVGARVVVEPSPLSVVASLGHGREVLAEAGVEGFGLVVDSWHHHVAGWTPADLADAVDLIAYVQTADGVEPAGADLMEQTLHHRRQPGTGTFDLAGFVDALDAAGYAGPWCTEVLDAGGRAEPVEVFAARSHRHLTALGVPT